MRTKQLIPTIVEDRKEACEIVKSSHRDIVTPAPARIEIVVFAGRCVTAAKLKKTTFLFTSCKY